MGQVFDPLRFSAASLDVLASGRASPEALAARQRARLDRLLTRAVRDSPFFRAHLRGRAGQPLSALPPVTRQALMDGFDDWVTDPQLTLSELRAFTADPGQVGKAYLGKFLVWESSGTSHQPGIFVQDAQTMGV